MREKPVKNIFESYPKLTLTAVMLISLVLVDFLAGLLFIPKDYDSYRIPSPWYHHDLIPNQHAISLWGSEEYEIFTNSLGFKDEEVRTIEKEVPKGKRRILLMGDSFTEGVGMNWENSFAGILSQNNPDIEILNAAVVSYSPKFYFLKTKYLLEQKHLEFNEMLVFIDNSDPMNEITYQSFISYPDRNFKIFTISLQRYFYKHSYLYHSVSSIFLKNQRNHVTESWNRILGEAFVDEVEEESNDFLGHMLDWSYNQDTFDKWGKKGLDLCKTEMDKLDSLCKINNIRLTLVIYPWPSVISQKNPNNIQVKFWNDFATEHHIDLINLYPEFINGTDAAAIRQQYFIESDVHWNKAGHRLIAEKIQAYIANFHVN